MGIRTRLIAATMAAAATLTAVVGTATASAVPASPTEAAPSEGKKPEGSDGSLARVAASLNVTVKQLTAALSNVKQATAKGTDKKAAVAAFAKELGISVAQAEKALYALSSDKGKPGGDKQPGVPAEAVKLLAAELRISADRARQVFRDLEKVKSRGEDIVKDPAFVAIVKGLGITPQHLLDTLRKVKLALKDKPKEKAPAGVPAK